MKTTTRSLTDGITVYEFTEETHPNGTGRYYKVYTLSHWDSQDNLLNECRMSKTKLTHIWQSLKKIGFTELVEPDEKVINSCLLRHNAVSYEFFVYKNSVLISKLQKYDIYAPGSTLYKGLIGPGICRLNAGWYTTEYARRCYKALLKSGYEAY